MKRVDWSERAIADIAAIRDYFEENRPDLTRSTIDAIVLSTDWLLQTPGAGTAIGYRRWRKWRAGRTPYLVFYEPRKSGLAVVRVLHERSDWWSIMA